MKSVGSLDNDEIIIDVFLIICEGIITNNHQSNLFGNQDIAGRINFKTLHLDHLDGPAYMTSKGVNDINVVRVLLVIGGAKEDLRSGLLLIIVEKNILAHDEEVQIIINYGMVEFYMKVLYYTIRETC